MKKIICLFGIVCLVLLSADARTEIAVGSVKTYQVVRVVDGDTLVVTDGNIRFKLRIAGMDAPEHDQPYGKVAKKILENLLSGKSFQIKPVGGGIDMYGRSLGQVFVKETDVSVEMIKQGYATYYRPTCKDFPADANRYNYDPNAYVVAEKTARAKKINIWTLPAFEMPCEYRKNKNDHK